MITGKRQYSLSALAAISAMLIALLLSLGVSAPPAEAGNQTCAKYQRQKAQTAKRLKSIRFDLAQAQKHYQRIFKRYSEARRAKERHYQLYLGIGERRERVAVQIQSLKRQLRSGDISPKKYRRQLRPLATKSRQLQSKKQAVFRRYQGWRRAFSRAEDKMETMLSASDVLRKLEKRFERQQQKIRSKIRRHCR
jgi:chromosome segregation ATPase